MKTILVCMSLSVLFFSCKEKAKDAQKNNDSSTIKNSNVTLEDALVYEDLLLKERLDGIIYENINTKNNGMQFAEQTPSYIKIPVIDLDLNQAFNISFTYNTSSDDGSKPQSFIAFVDEYSSPSKTIPLYIYSASKRLTGIYGDQSLWANNYNRTNGESMAYFDSYQLKSNVFYFVSVNFTGSSINIYINSELYAAFDNIKPHSLKYNNIIIGALPQGDDFVSQFKGIIHGLKIYRKSLNEEEIISVYNSQPNVDL